MRHPYTISKPGTRLTSADAAAQTAIPTSTGQNIDGSPKKAQWVMIYVEDDDIEFQFVDNSSEVVVRLTGIKTSFAGENPMAFNVGGATHISVISTVLLTPGQLRIYPLEDH